MRAGGVVYYLMASNGGGILYNRESKGELGLSLALLLAVIDEAQLPLFVQNRGGC